MESSVNLFDAIVDNNLNLVNCLIGKGMDVNCSSKSGEMPLHLAIEKGYTDIALSLINSGCNLDTKNYDDKTPLFLASQYNNVKVISVLLSRTSLNINLYCYGKTPLHVACEEGHNEVVKEFVNNYRTMFWIDVRFHGDLPIHVAVNLGYNDITLLLLNKMTSINSIDKEGRTPLWIALKSKHSDVIKTLLNNYRVNSNFRYEGQTLLLFALKEHMEEEVKLLVDKGANIMARDADKKTALHHCAIQGMPELLQLFIDKGVELNATDTNGYTAFHHSVTLWNPDVIKVFIKNGVEIDSRLTTNYYHYTPLQLAFKRGNFEVAKLLIENGADINAVDPRAHYARSRGGTLLHWACRGIIGAANHESYIQFLVENGANVNAEENDGRTPLCLLVKHYGSLESMKYLIENGAELNTNKGGTPLYWAFYMRYNDIAEFLINNGSDVNYHIDNFYDWFRFKTPLHLARDLSVVKLLIDKGANVNAQDKEGNTPLHCALSRPIAQCLIANGAEISLCNFAGDSPLHYAENVHIAELLIELGAIVDITNHRGCTPLHTAKDVSIARLLIENGADVRVLNREGRTVLHSVAEIDVYTTRGVAELIDYFIEKGVDPNATDNQGNSAVKLSSISMNQEVAKVLLNKGATLPLFNVESNGCNIFFLKKLNELFDTLKSDNPIKKSMDMIRMCLPLNYKEEDTKSTLLHVAAKYGQDIFINSLAVHSKINNQYINHVKACNRINLNALDIDGQTPLHIASKENNYSIVQSLLLGGCIYNSKTNYGSTPLDLTVSSDIANLLKLTSTAFKAVVNNDLNTLSSCIKSEKCLINALNQDGCSLLYTACNNNNRDIISFLLNKNADILLVNNRKESILHIATGSKDYDTVFLILKHLIQSNYLERKVFKIKKINENWDSKLAVLYDFVNLKTVDGITALHLASQIGSLEITKILVRCGSMFNSKDENGRTPLNFSTDETVSKLLNDIEELFLNAKNGEIDVSEKLKRNNIFTSLVRNKFGNTLYEYVLVNGHKNIAEEIKRNGLIFPKEFIGENEEEKNGDINGDSESSDGDWGFGLFD